jgi:hypothetical protein
VTSLPDQQPAPQRGLLVIYSALMLAILLAALDQTIVATALPTIVSDLGGLSHLSWVVTSYILASTATTQVWGKLSEDADRNLIAARTAAGEPQPREPQPREPRPSELRPSEPRAGEP